tara:strand:+ start:10015 stop:11163 length:1149 start_codon:yes stop_codon:yes gene_type:complete
MSETFSFAETHSQLSTIKVIGVGGGGNNTIRHLLGGELASVDLICANTDIQALEYRDGVVSMPLGRETTKGLGAGANPEVGRLAAIEDREVIAESLQNTDLLFITAGMGGGTGTGAAPIIAEIARQAGILTVGIVTMPFAFEGKKRYRIAEEGLKALKANLNALLVIPNQNLMKVMDPATPIIEAFSKANDVLRSALEGVVSLISKPGLINLDFEDVKRILKEEGLAMFGQGEGQGEHRARDAVTRAATCPLLAQDNLHQARGILVNICSGDNFSIGEFTEIGDYIDQLISDNATVIIGTSIDPSLKDRLTVTLIATGLADSFERGQPKKQSRVALDGTDDDDKHAVLRPRRLKTINGNKDSDILFDYADMNIPTFLKRQND